MIILELLDRYSWVLFAWYAVAFTTAAISLCLHMRMTPPMRRRMTFVLVACVLAAIGSVLGGMQAGADPLWLPARTIPWVRFCWTAAATLVIIDCLRYLMYLRSRSY